MSSTMLNTKTLVELTTATLALALCLPGVLADDVRLARTTDGGCVYVNWTTSPYVVSPATGCTSSDDCVYVDATASPPSAHLDNNCV